MLTRCAPSYLAVMGLLLVCSQPSAAAQAVLGSTPVHPRHNMQWTSRTLARLRAHRRRAQNGLGGRADKNRRETESPSDLCREETPDRLAQHGCAAVRACYASATRALR